MLSVGDRVLDDVLEENLEHAAGLLVDESADALDTTPASQAADGGLGDALDVVPEDLPVALGASLTESLSSLSASSLVVMRRKKSEREEVGLARERETDRQGCVG